MSKFLLPKNQRFMNLPSNYCGHMPRQTPLIIYRQNHKSLIISL
jgi:hypothetical protein